MRVALERFNAHDDGRHTVVLLHLQHAFEMLLKAGLVQSRARVFDPETGRSIGFSRCLHEAQTAPKIKLTTDEAGTLRAIDALRDDEQHWHTSVDEGLLYSMPEQLSLSSTTSSTGCSMRSWLTTLLSGFFRLVPSHHRTSCC